MRPRIGVATSVEENQQRIDLDYIRAVESAGGLPLVLPVLSDPVRLKDLLDMLDGLVIPGGGDISQGLVGSLPQDLDATDSRRRHSDETLLKVAVERGLPILGICYGMQLINAFCGGTIYADVEEQMDGSHTHSEKRGSQGHKILIQQDTHLARALGRSELHVNSRHIQAVAEAGEGLIISARADDGVIEALETVDGQLLGVQFHPEKMGDDGLPLFHHLVERSAFDEVGVAR